jgi:hypothetical protein
MIGTAGEVIGDGVGMSEGERGVNGSEKAVSDWVKEEQVAGGWGVIQGGRV